MKKAFLLLFLSASSLALCAQDYFEKIVNKSCECVDDVPEGLSQEEFNMKFGLCIMNSASEYQEELKRDYGIDFAKIESQGEELGRLIGMKMAGACPDILMKVAQMNSESEQEVNLDQNTLSGEIISVQKEQFVVFSVRNDEGKPVKLHWLGFVSSDDDLVNNYQNLKGENAWFEFTEQEFFDPRIGEYRNFKVITAIELE